MKTKATYRVSVYDYDETASTNWRVRYKRVSQWGLRKVLRRLYSEGYERDTSLMVEASEYLARAKEAAASLAAYDREQQTGQVELFQ